MLNKRLLLSLAFALLCLGRTSMAATSAKKIVFSSDRGGTWQIWEMDEKGGSPKQLSKASGDEKDVDPMFSPDLKRILFTSTRGEKIGLWVMNADGSEPKRVCDGDQGEWGPDSNQIVLRRNKIIVIHNIKTKKETNLTPKDWSSSAPSWSPDGKTIAFAALFKNQNGLYLIPPTGGKPKKLYDKVGACEPHWSADSKVLAYETTTHVYTINADGTDNVQITGFGGVQRYPRFSPDGKNIVFCQGSSEKGPWQVYSITTDGDDPVKISDKGSNMYPDWR